MKFTITIRLADGRTDESEVKLGDHWFDHMHSDPIVRNLQIKNLLKPIADDMIARLAGAEWTYEVKTEDEK